MVNSCIQDENEAGTHCTVGNAGGSDPAGTASPITGHGQYVFPNPRAPRGDRPMSENAVRVALRTLGFDNSVVTAHGFRATIRTIGAEVLGENPLVLEAQLAHRVPDALGTAYNRTSYLPQRRVFMQQWADYLDQLRTN